MVYRVSLELTLSSLGQFVTNFSMPLTVVWSMCSPPFSAWYAEKKGTTSIQIKFVSQMLESSFLAVYKYLILCDDVLGIMLLQYITEVVDREKKGVRSLLLTGDQYTSRKPTLSMCVWSGLKCSCTWTATPDSGLAVLVYLEFLLDGSEMSCTRESCQ